MADETQRVIFGSEFDGSKMAAGVDAAVAKLEELKEQQRLNKEEVRDFTVAVKDNEKAMKALEKQIQNTSKSSKDNINEVKRMQAELDQLRQKNITLGNSLKASEKDLRGNTTAVKDHSRAVSVMEKETNRTTVALNKMTSVGHLTGQTVNNLRGQVASAAAGIISGFAGGIIAFVIPTLTKLIVKLFDVGKETDKLAKQKKILNEVFAAAAKSVGDDIAKLEVYKNKLNDTNIPAAERIKIAKEYNKTAEETNKIDLKQIDNLQLINEKIEKQNKLIIQRAVSVAALSKLTEAATTLVDLELQFSQALKQSGLTEADVYKQLDLARTRRLESLDNSRSALDNYSGSLNKNTRDLKINADASDVAITKNTKNLIDLINMRGAARKNLQDMAALLNPLITPDGLTTPGRTPGTQEIENVFAQKLVEFRARLAAASASAFLSETLIRDKFDAQLNKEFADIGKLLKDKKLTGPQADILKGLLRQINEVELSKGLEEFRKKREAAMKAVNNAIVDLDVQLARQRVDNLRDEFEQERQAIELNFEQTVRALNSKLDEMLRGIDEQVKAGTLDPGVGDEKKGILRAIFGDLLTQAGIARTNKQLDTAFKQFQRTLDAAKLSFENEALILSEETTTLIQEQTGLFLRNEISYKKYQENVTKIVKEESQRRKQILLTELSEQLLLINAQISETSDPAQLQKLQAQQRQVRGQISALNREIAGGEAEEVEDGRLKRFVEYAQAVQGLAQSVLQFWQQVNQAEAAALDRSISLQNKRVENAREIAERGNAEYLEMEQKRLDELERKREDNARKQIAINNALTLSQATVAAISAIAQAVQTGSPFAAIAAVAVVIGAIGAAYSFVQSLQPQEATFFEGTEYVQGAGRPLGKDTVPARLHIGERVVTAQDNKEYWGTLSAIHNHKIPPTVLNDFVELYPNFGVPAIDYSRLTDATEGRHGADSFEVVSKLQGLNEKMGEVVKAVSSLGIDVIMDEEGFAAALYTYNKKKKLRNRA